METVTVAQTLEEFLKIRKKLYDEGIYLTSVSVEVDNDPVAYGATPRVTIRACSRE